MSVQPRKQRKARYSASAHARSKYMSATLSKDLRKKFGTRTLPLKVGDKVEVLRGDFKETEGKIMEVDYNSYKVCVEDVTLSKPDGTTVYYPLDPSNLMIIKASTSDKRRMKNKGDK